MNIDGFNQREIKGKIYNRINNPNRQDGAWLDPQLKTMVKTFRKSGHVVKEVEREANKLPANLASPDKDLSKEQLKVIKIQAKAFEERQKGRYDIYVRQGNPVAGFADLKASEEEE